MRTGATFIGVWFVASLLNGFLSGIAISVSDAGSMFNFPAAILLSCIVSFFLSIPLIVLVAIATAVAGANGKSGHALFQVVLTAALICGIAGALFFMAVFGNEFRHATLVMGLCIIVSAMGSVLILRKRFKTAQ